MKTLFRWIFMIPIAAIASVLATVICKMMALLTQPEWYNKSFAPLITDIVSMYIFVIVSAYIAPKYKQITGKVVAILFFTILAIILVAPLFTDKVINDNSNVENISALVGILIAYVHISKFPESLGIESPTSLIKP